MKKINLQNKKKKSFLFLLQNNLKKRLKNQPRKTYRPAGRHYQCQANRLVEIQFNVITHTLSCEQSHRRFSPIKAKNANKNKKGK